MIAERNAIYRTIIVEVEENICFGGPGKTMEQEKRVNGEEILFGQKLQLKWILETQKPD